MPKHSKLPRYLVDGDRHLDGVAGLADQIQVKTCGINTVMKVDISIGRKHVRESR